MTSVCLIASVDGKATGANLRDLIGLDTTVPVEGSHLLGLATVSSHTGVGTEHFPLLVPVHGAQKVVSVCAARSQPQVLSLSIASHDWEGIKQPQRQHLTSNVNELAKFALWSSTTALPIIKLFETPVSEPELGAGYLYSWCTDLYSTKRCFAVQKWGYFMHHPPRVVMFDFTADDSETRKVFPLASCSNESAAFQFLDYLSTREQSDDFSRTTFYQAWKHITANT